MPWRQLDALRAEPYRLSPGRQQGLRLYEILKALHIEAVIAVWLIYLPRLFYHADASKDSARSETFKVIERRLLRGIMNPAIILVWVLGLLLTWQGDWWHVGWWQMKLSLVAGLTLVHHLYGRWRKEFEADRNTRPAPQLSLVERSVDRPHDRHRVPIGDQPLRVRCPALVR